MSYFSDSSEITRKEVAPGVVLRTMWGDKVMISLVEVAPGAIMPLYSHPTEQTGIMMQGEFEMAIGGETRVLKPDGPKNGRYPSGFGAR